jgi:hypothetical protein
VRSSNDSARARALAIVMIVLGLRDGRCASTLFERH